MTNSVYDPETENKAIQGSLPPSAEGLSQMTGLGADEQAAIEARAREGAAQDAEKNTGEGDGGLFKGAADSSTPGIKGPGLFRGKADAKTKKRRTLLGIMSLSGIGIVGALVVTFTLGPGQLLQLSQILQNANDAGENTTSIRTGALIRWAKTGNFGETRVGMVGSKSVARLLPKLDSIGITFDRTSLDHVKAAQIDLSKLQKQYPELKGMSEAQQTKFLTEKFPTIKASDIEHVNGQRVTINTERFNVQATRALIKDSSRLLSDGKILNRIGYRSFAKFTNNPGMFHTMQRKVAEKGKEITIKLDNKALEKAQTEAEKALTQSTENSPEAVKAAESMKGRIGGLDAKSAAGSALLVTAVICEAKGGAHDAMILNRDKIVTKTAVHSVEKSSAGSQVMGMSDVSNASIAQQSVGVSSVFGGGALQSLAGEPVTGPILPEEYKQAYSKDSSAAVVNQKLELGGFSDIVCSPVGQAAQGVAALTLLVGSFGTSTLTKGAAAGVAAKIFGTAGALALFRHEFTNLLADKPLVPDIFKGELGGNFYAYGAKAAANITSMPGGVELTSAQTAELEQPQIELRQKEFQNRPLFARLFDRNDYRSALARSTRGVSPDAAQNLQTVATSFTRIGSMIPHAFSSMFSKVHAAGPYDWGFPSYGVPPELLKDARLSNPYSNADAVAAILDSSGGADYISKAETCFGSTISKDGDGLWGVTADRMVDPHDDDYIAANCADMTDFNWARILMFVFDTRTAEAFDCFQGGAETSDQSCQDIGASTNTATSNAAQPSISGSLAEGSSQDLAKQLLPYISDGSIFCGAPAGGSGPTNCNDIQKTASGEDIGGNCQVKALTPHLLALFLGLVKDDGWKIGISATCSDHHPEGDGPYAGHSYGSTADFSVENGAAGASAASNEKFVKDVAALLSASGGSFGQVGSCHPIYDSQKNSKFITFDDLCNHQHVRAAP